MGKVRRDIRPSALDALPGIAVLAVLAGSTACQGKLERDARACASDPAAPVTVARPVSTTVTESSDHTGRADAVDSVEVRAQVGGQLQRIAFREGEIVKKVHLLFGINPRPYETVSTPAKCALQPSKSHPCRIPPDTTPAD